MFAIIQTGGKQYKVSPNTQIDVEKLEGKAGDKVVFDQVLLMSEDNKTEIGTPHLEVKLEAEIVEQKRGPKIDILRFQAKSRSRRRQGHRQDLTTVKFGTFKVSEKIESKPATNKETKTK